MSWPARVPPYSRRTPHAAPDSQVSHWQVDWHDPRPSGDPNRVVYPSEAPTPSADRHATWPVSALDLPSAPPYLRWPAIFRRTHRSGRSARALPRGGRTSLAAGQRSSGGRSRGPGSTRWHAVLSMLWARPISPAMAPGAERPDEGVGRPDCQQTWAKGRTLRG
jgi:hypothetical protein